MVNIKSWLSSHWPNHFSHLYTVTDNITEIPVQVAAYNLVTEAYLAPTDRVLDIGFGLGYGLCIMSCKVDHLVGVEVDRKAFTKSRELYINNNYVELIYYDGYHLPFGKSSFDIVTCVDVLEHVKDYYILLQDIIRITRRAIVISTPNRKPEYTRLNGRPKNPWHIREWSYLEFNEILRQLGFRYEWNFINGPWEGPLSISKEITSDTLALAPVIWFSHNNLQR